MPANGQNGTPAYQRIQSAIRERIEAGHLRPGDAVTSERELAKLNGVSLMTARHALATLEREGVVERPTRLLTGSRDHHKYRTLTISHIRLSLGLT